MTIKTDLSGILPFVGGEMLDTMREGIMTSHQTLLRRDGRGNDFLGWLDLPQRMDASLLDDIRRVAGRLSACSDVCVVIGIGGSYLGARAVIDALRHAFSTLLEDRKAPEIVYAGHQLSSDYQADLHDLLDQKDYSLIVISKSGTTTEPALAFRFLRSHLERKYGKAEACRRIVAITDREKGALKKLADAEHFDQFVVPDDVGGRFSVLSPVGLLPVAVAGLDIDGLLNGALEAREQLMGNADPDKNPALMYALGRNACYRKGYRAEVLVNYDPRLFYLTEWWKQLYGESEGKEGKGIFPAGVSFTTDLHSMGQYLQEGVRQLFETVISIEKPGREVKVQADAGDADGLNFVAGKSLHEINHMAEAGTFLAHQDGDVPVQRIVMEELNAYNLGQLLYFFEYACAVSGYFLGVNPFDQPGVEAYKKNMFALLGKPGFEEQTAALRKRAKHLL